MAKGGNVFGEQKKKAFRIDSSFFSVTRGRDIPAEKDLEWKSNFEGKSTISFFIYSENTSQTREIFHNEPRRASARKSNILVGFESQIRGAAVRMCLCISGEWRFCCFFCVSCSGYTSVAFLCHSLRVMCPSHVLFLELQTPRLYAIMFL